MNSADRGESTLPLDAAMRLDEICDEFEEALLESRKPRIESRLGGEDAAFESHLVRHLLRIEIEYCVRAGKKPLQEDYLARFPDEGAAVEAAFAATRQWLDSRKRGTLETLDASRAPSETLDSGQETAPSARTGQTRQENIDWKIDDYQLLEEIAFGGMGVVYRAKQVKLNRVVAVKMIRSGPEADEDDLSRFHREAEAVAALQHPNIVQIFDIGEHASGPYLSLEYVSGGTLRDRMGHRPWSCREAAVLVETLARAVHYAHQRNIVHRDIKPANVLMTPEGEPKLSDFGLAKQLESRGKKTLSGSILGTPIYMSPEQAAGHTDEIGPAADIYALGVMLYELITGRVPFKGATALETIEMVLNRPPESPRAIRPETDRDLEAICLRCLAKEAGQRYASAKALAEDLQRYLQHRPIAALRRGPLGRAKQWVRRQPAQAALAGVVFVAAAVAL